MEVGSANRIRSCALDLLAMVWETVADGEEDEEGWELMGRDLRLKATFLFCDFAHLISAAPHPRKQPLTDLANRLLQYIHEVPPNLLLNFVHKLCSSLFIFHPILIS